MTCIKCHHGQTKRFGFVGKHHIQRYRCTFCNTTFVEPRPKPLDSHYLPLEKATQALSMMLEGMSVRAISRLTGIDKNTVLSLMLTAGRKARAVSDALIRDIPARRVQAVLRICRRSRLKASCIKWGNTGFGANIGEGALITAEEAVLILRKWQEEQTPLRVAVQLANLHLDSAGVVIGATPLRFGLRLPGEHSFFELDFGSCVFDFGHDPNAPDRTGLLCVLPEGRFTLFEI
jgi:transposase-like protein